MIDENWLIDYKQTVRCEICGHLAKEHAEKNGQSHLGDTATGYCGCVLSKEEVAFGRGNYKPFTERREREEMRTLLAATTVEAIGKSGGANGYAKLSAVKVVAHDEDGEIRVKIIPVTSKGEVQVDADITIDLSCMTRIAKWFLAESVIQGW